MDREHHEGLRHSHHTARTINPPIRWAYLIAFTVQQHGLPTHGAAIGSLAVLTPSDQDIQRGLRMEGLHPATSFVVRFSQNDLARCHRNATWMKVLARKVWVLVTRMTQKQKRFRNTDPTRCSSSSAASHSVRRSAFNQLSHTHRFKPALRSNSPGATRHRNIQETLRGS